MLINTLKTLIKAGNSALGSASGLPVTREEITQVRCGQLTFPSMGEIGFSAGTLQSVRLGCDDSLNNHLAQKYNSSGTDSGIEILANRFLDTVLQEMAGRNPRGWLQDLDVGPITLHSRGVRSYGFRFQTDNGQFFLMAEVPSKTELERAKGNDYYQSMVSRYLPHGWESSEKYGQTHVIENFLIFMRKAELDVRVEVSTDNELTTTHNGILVADTTVDGLRVLELAMDVSGSEGKALEPGDEVTVRVGVQDRALTFTSEFKGEGSYSVTNSVAIKSVLLSVPSELRIGQMRRTFRLGISERIPVEIESSDPGTQDNTWFEDGNPETGAKAKGRLADLSFSGARIIADRGELLEWASEFSQVICRVFFPDAPEPVKIMGMIRRTTISLADRDSQQDEIGLEFLVNDEKDRLAVEWIRQYVLSQQRSRLSDRIHVAG
jgi:c-di-GMP-binding flagellar brake protein YcgR